MIRSFLVFLPLLLLAQAPHAFNTLGEEIDKERLLFLTLSNHPKLQNYKEEVDAYCDASNRAFSVGYELDTKIEEIGEVDDKLKMIYLKDLRALKKRRKKLKHFYFQEVASAIQAKENDYFLFLIRNAKPLLDENKILKSKVLNYVQEASELKQHQCIKDLLAEKELNERSYAFTQKLQDEYRAYQEVLRHQEALRLRALLVAKKKGGVIVYAKEQKGDISFVMENLFEMHVSATLYIQDIQGYMTEAVLPYKLVLKPKEKREVLTLRNSDVNKKTGHFSSHIAWSKGDVNAQHDETFIYALPFHESRKVSQGFDGGTSHKGNSKYAVDFTMPVGTPVYAARGGKVVEIVQNNNRHGMSLDMRQYANYVIIEHKDGTLGRYFHLKYQGVKVKLGAEIKKGELVALSGNTGRTSGAHLHFVVTKAQEYKDGYTSVSVPVKFKCSEGLLEKPVEGKFYCSIKNE